MLWDWLTQRASRSQALATALDATLTKHLGRPAVVADVDGHTVVVGAAVGSLRHSTDEGIALRCTMVCPHVPGFHIARRGVGVTARWRAVKDGRNVSDMLSVDARDVLMRAPWPELAWMPTAGGGGVLIADEGRAVDDVAAVRALAAFATAVQAQSGHPLAVPARELPAAMLRAVRDACVDEAAVERVGDTVEARVSAETSAGVAEAASLVVTLPDPRTGIFSVVMHAALPSSPTTYTLCAPQPGARGTRRVGGLAVVVDPGVDRGVDVDVAAGAATDVVDAIAALAPTTLTLRVDRDQLAVTGDLSVVDGVTRVAPLFRLWRSLVAQRVGLSA